MLHPQTRALLQLVARKTDPLMHTMAPADARAYYRDRRFYTQPEPPPVGAVADLQMEGPGGPLSLRSYRPLGAADDAVLPVLVYYHGGGWTVGDLDTHDVLCRQLCNQSGVAVVAVDYRLSPDHRFPAAVEDALAAARWVRAHAHALRVDPARLAVGGDSAGGNLAAVVALAARDAGDLPIRFQLLIYPSTDQRRMTPSYQANGRDYLLTSDAIDTFYANYFQGTAQEIDWRVSPLLHADHAGLPPALVLIAGYDPLRDEALQYAQKLSEAGCRATLVNFERQIHGFITMGRVIDEANTAVEWCARQLAVELG